MNKKSDVTNFSGFKPETVKFLEDLAVNNNREWFHEHRHEYETHFLAPSFAFINTMGARLAREVDGLQYEARVDRSLWRLNRDVRFSNVKVPYKTNVGIVFWKGPFTNRVENPGFYFHIEPQQLFLAVGSWMFAPDMMKAYREALLDKRLGGELLEITKELQKDGIHANSEMALKKYPKGFDENHPLAHYSRFKGLYASQDDSGALPDIVFKPELIDFCMAFYTKCIKLHGWLVKVAEKVNREI